ncbi:unnamed protein product [[Actinomadura] parvosata subsp. kistnae]|nr:unnamed protein product [Actinomadura parvosata subsp. kistnae]
MRRTTPPTRTLRHPMPPSRRCTAARDPPARHHPTGAALP